MRAAATAAFLSFRLMRTMNLNPTNTVRSLLLCAALQSFFCVAMPGQGDAPAADAVRYRIQAGDTLDSIGERTFARKDLARLLHAKNPGLNPKRLRIGQIIALPTASEVAEWQEPVGIEDANAALAAAKLAEEAEGDLRKAADGYATLAADATVDEPVRDEARLRLAAIALRTGDRARAEATLTPMTEAGGARAERAQAVLQGQAAQGQDEIAATLAKRARSMLQEMVLMRGIGKWEHFSAAFEKDWARLLQDAAWLGVPAAVAVIGQLEEERKGVAQPEVVSGLADILLRTGSPATVAYYQGAARDADPVWRLRLLGAGANQHSVARDLKPALFEFLRAPDPDGKVVERLQLLTSEIDTKDVLRLAADPAPAARVFAFWAVSGMASKARNAMPGGPDALFTTTDIDTMVGLVNAALDDRDPAVARNAHMALGQLVGLSQRAAESFVQRLPKLAQTAGYVSSMRPQRIDDALVTRMVEAAVALGRLTPEAGRASSGRMDPRPMIANFLGAEGHEWTAASVEGLCKLAELGYLVDSSGPLFLARLRSVATGEQWARVLEQAPQVGEKWFRRVMEEFSMPVEAVPVLQRLFADFAKGPGPIGWETRTLVEEKSRSKTEGTWIAYWLLAAVGASGDGSHAAWIVEQAKAFPVLANGAEDALARMEVRLKKDLRVLDAMSDLLESDVLAQLVLVKQQALLACLVNGAHADGPAVFARLVEAGGDASFYELAGCVVGTLSEADAKAKLLWPDYLKASHDLFDFLASAPQTPLAEDALATVLLRLAEQPNASLAGKTKDLIHKAEVRARPDVRWAMRAAVWQPMFLEHAVLNGWNVEWLADFEEDLRASLLKSKQPQQQLRALVACDKPVSAAEWKLGLEHEDANARAVAIAALPRGIDAEVRKMLFARLGDEDWQVRSIAVEVLNKVVPLDVLVTEGVAGLVPLMRDPNSSVKEAATKVLDDLRRYQEQRAFWDRFQAGVQTGPEATVSKLLLQAKAGQPKEQRLLAIDALASIGQMDALPYLIEMTTDSDPELANLARGAVGTLRVNIAQRALQPK